MKPTMFHRSGDTLIAGSLPMQDDRTNVDPWHGVEPGTFILTVISIGKN